MSERSFVRGLEDSISLTWLVNLTVIYRFLRKSLPEDAAIALTSEEMSILNGNCFLPEDLDEEPENVDERPEDVDEKPEDVDETSGEDFFRTLTTLVQKTQDAAESNKCSKAISLARILRSQYDLIAKLWEAGSLSILEGDE